MQSLDLKVHLADLSVEYLKALDTRCDTPLPNFPGPLATPDEITAYTERCKTWALVNDSVDSRISALLTFWRQHRESLQ